MVTDLHMPGLDGVAATREVLARSPGTGVLILTLHDDDTSIVAALRAGARGYLVKGADRAEIVRAVEGVAAGCGNHAIAGRLHLSEKTVRNHLSALLAKVGVPDRSALLVTARKAGLGHASAGSDGRPG